MFETKIWPEWPEETPYKDPRQYKDPNQLEMEFLWPHRGIQLSLDLDKPEQPKKPWVISGTQFKIEPLYPTWGKTSINTSAIDINITDSVGNLNIGGMSVGLKESPKWYQRILYKLLGFDWRKNG